MKKVREFRRRAGECRKLSAKASMPDLKTHFDDMARVWDKLAQERLSFFVEPREADNDDALETEATRWSDAATG
jgi:hypothetical protein